MKHIKLIIFIAFIALTNISLAQVQPNDTIHNKTISLDDVVISANKSEETKKTVPQQIQVISAMEIRLANAQNSADLLQSNANVFVQKSQQGGGSPVIRGFESSRILLVIDGVRMNNIIYRAGHLQNIITLDNSIIDRVEILNGPASTVYGSDALGGVIHFYTKKPQFATGEQTKNFNLNFSSRYGSVNSELAEHVDFNIGFKRFSSLTSVTYSKFGDMKSGKNMNPFYNKSLGERPFYIDRIGNTDSMIENSDKYLQKQSAYSQYDILQKFAFKQNSNVTHGVNFQYSNSTDIPRYDRLTEYSGTKLTYAKWYYGPQKRIMGAYNLDVKNTEAVFQNIHFGLNYQNIEESRNSRKVGKPNISHRIENVNVIGANLDLQKIMNKNTIYLGLDGQYNTLKSTANNENIITGESTPLDTRYPDGDNTLSSFAFYVSHTLKLNENFSLVDGVRVGYNMLHSIISDNSFYNLPVTEANQNTPVYSGNFGVINTPSNDIKLSLLFSTGFRAANIDDLSKVFETSKGNVIVPNADLKPEKTLNTEFGITKIFENKAKWENTVYFTQFVDAVVTEKFTLNGNDSILFDGTMSKIYANQNKGKAYIYGISSSLQSQMSDNLLFTVLMNYTYGRVKTDSTDYPLGHIPPFMTSLRLSYTNKNFASEFFVNYNGWKKIKDYNMGGEDNEQYATPEGMPAWFTTNISFSYTIKKHITLQCGVYNIFDTQYRAFASGINAPGRNIFGTLRINL